MYYSIQSMGKDREDSCIGIGTLSVVVRELIFMIKRIVVYKSFPEKISEH